MSIMVLLKKLFTFLTAPSKQLSLADQQRASSFSMTHVILIILGTLIQTTFIILDNGNNVDNLIKGYLVTVLFLLPSYILSRTKYYKIGALLFGLLVNYGIYYQINIYRLGAQLRGFEEESGAYVFFLSFLILPVIVYSLLLTIKMTVLVSAMSIITCIFILNGEINTNVQGSVRSSIFFLLLTSSFTVIASRYRNWVEVKNKRDLEDSEKKYRQLLGAAFEGVALIQQGKIIESNDLFTNMFGFESDVALGQLLTDFIPTANTNTLQTTISMEGASETVLELQGIHKRGTPLMLEVLVHEQSYEGAPAYALAVRDITHRRETEATILQAQRLDSIGVLAGGIAHDFNNLLTGIMGHSSLIRMKIGKEHNAQRHVDGIISTTKHAGELTQQLMTYAGKRTEINTTAPLDLNKLIHDNQGWFETTIGRQVALNFELQQGLPLIEADRSQIQQVLMNLVINARDACEETDGGILISTSLATMAEEKPVYTIDKTSPAPGEYVCLQVHDTGSGVAPEVVERIFEPFYSTKGQGRGLGLAATLGVIQGHNGYVSLETAVSHGTTFNVYFPATQKTKDSVAQDLTPSTIEQSSEETILLIEDDSAIRELVSEGLRKVGHTLFTAEDGIDGISQFKKQQAIIDIVVLDVQMPIMDGVDVLHYMKKLNPNVPVVISSGYSTVDLTSISEQYSGVSFLPKPYAVTQLADHIDTVLNNPIELAQAHLVQK